MTANVDSYRIQARLIPSLLVVLPAGLGVLAFQPAKSTLLNALAGVVTSFGLTILLEQFGRDLGKKKEPYLFKRFGGRPTTLQLSHGHSSLEPATLKRYHLRLAKLIPGMRMPTPRDEDIARDAAFETYESCTRFLREKTRDKTKFRLVFAENVTYGFRRNLWAMKPAGVFVSALGIAACVVSIGCRTTTFDAEHLTVPLVCLGICVWLLVAWFLRITVKWVEVAANEYAGQLLAACDSL